MKNQGVVFPKAIGCGQGVRQKLVGIHPAICLLFLYHTFQFHLTISQNNLSSKAIAAYSGTFVIKLYHYITQKNVKICSTEEEEYVTTFVRNGIPG